MRMIEGFVVRKEFVARKKTGTKIFNLSKFVSTFVRIRLTWNEAAF